MGNSGVIVIFVIYQTFTVTKGFGCNYDADHQWNIIGVYSACYNETNRTELNYLAEALDKTVKYIWGEKAKGSFLYFKKPTNLSYLSFDVCNNFTKLPAIVESIKLNKSLHYKTWSKKSKNIVHLSKVVAIYAEGPPEMMDYLEASFHGDIRFAGKEVSFNSSIDGYLFNVYANILHYIITHRLKWGRLLILHVQPSLMKTLFDSLMQMIVKSKLCVQFKQVDQSWRIIKEDYFTLKWFQENKPAVIIIGDKYGQVEVVKQLAFLMKIKNFTIPILVEGLARAMEMVNLAPDNFNCFKGINSSFISTSFDSFSYIEYYFLKEEIELFESVSRLVNKTISLSQRYVLKETMFFDWLFHSRECACPLDYDCNMPLIKSILMQFTGDLLPSSQPALLSVISFILDKDFTFYLSVFEKYRSEILDMNGWTKRDCRKKITRRQHFRDVLLGNLSKYHKNHCADNVIGAEYCWRGINAY